MRKIAATSLEKLFAAGKKKGIKLYGVSGYRSYTRQKEIYDRNVATRGKAATDAVSAIPGSSEHQTGLTIDVSAQSVSYRLDQSFGDTKEENGSPNTVTNTDLSSAILMVKKKLQGIVTSPGISAMSEQPSPRIYIKTI